MAFNEKLLDDYVLFEYVLNKKGAVCRLRLKNFGNV